MPYTVIWQPTAVERLTTVWLNAVDGNEVTVASFRLDYSLRFLDQFISIPPPSPIVRLIKRSPLVAFYEVKEQDKIIRVLFLFAIPPYQKRPEP